MLGIKHETITKINNQKIQENAHQVKTTVFVKEEYGVIL